MNKYFDILKSRRGRMGIGVLLIAVAAWGILSVDPTNPPDLAIFFGRFHPLFVHLPIGFLIAAFLLEFAGRRERFERVRSAVPLVLLLSAVSAALAVAAGYLLAMGGDYDAATLAWHKRLGIGVAVVSFIAYGLKEWTLRRPTARLQQAYTGVLIVTIGLLAVAGHFGGSLTHGSQYLIEYMPETIRYAMALGPGDTDEWKIENIDEAVIYSALVQPILKDRCVSCHGADKQKGELRLDSPEGIQAGGDSGPAVAPGRAADSEMIRRIWLPSGHDDHMPPQGRRPLTVVEAELIRWWIDAGASYDMLVADTDIPDNVQAILDQIAPRSHGVTGILAQDMAPADPMDVAQVESLGVTITPLSGATGFLHAHTTNARETFGDAELAALRPLARQVTWLDLGGTQVSDTGLAMLGDLENLTRLHLERTAITDAGLAHLSGLAHLRYLNLYGTQVTDAGLEALAGLKDLRTLYLWQTGVTEAGVNALQEQLPRLQVSLGLSFEPADSSATPVQAASLSSD